MQPIEGTAEYVKRILEEEYKLLCQCHGFKAAFDEHAKRLNVVNIPSMSFKFLYVISKFTYSNLIPEFYFNFPSSILGELITSPLSKSWRLPYHHFLATPLLPCGEADPKIKKFMGNDEIGKASDNLSQAIHAFTHFSVIYSQWNLLFCDLQGKY